MNDHDAAILVWAPLEWKGSGYQTQFYPEFQEGGSFTDHVRGITLYRGTDYSHAKREADRHYIHIQRGKRLAAPSLEYASASS